MACCEQRHDRHWRVIVIREKPYWRYTLCHSYQELKYAKSLVLRWKNKVSVTHMYHLKRNMKSSTSQTFSTSQSFSIAYLHEIGYKLTCIFSRIFAFWILLKMFLRVRLLMRRWQAFAWTNYGQVLWQHVALSTKGHTRTLYSKCYFETEMRNGTAFP